MKLTEVAIVAVDGFSPFHYSVPCMLFGDTVSETKRFNLHICAERPGLLSARDGFALNASGDFSLLAQVDIVVVPYWGAVHQRPPQSLLDSLVRARENGAEIVGLCLGAFVLGYAGLLDGKLAQQQVFGGIYAHAPQLDAALHFAAAPVDFLQAAGAKDGQVVVAIAFDGPQTFDLVLGAADPVVNGVGLVRAINAGGRQAHGQPAIGLGVAPLQVLQHRGPLFIHGGVAVDNGHVNHPAFHF